jgi:hypothetical protein
MRIKTLIAVTAFALAIGKATAGPDMAHYKVPTMEKVHAFVDSSMKNIPVSEYEFPPHSRRYQLDYDMEYHSRGPSPRPRRLRTSQSALAYPDPSANRCILFAKWLAGALGRAFDSKCCDTQFFVDVIDGDKSYEAYLSPILEWEPGGPSWNVTVTERNFRYLN